MLPFNIFLVVVSVVIGTLRFFGYIGPSYQAAAHMWLGYLLGFGVAASLVGKLFRLPEYYLGARKLRDSKRLAYYLAAALVVVEVVSFLRSQ